MRLILIAKDSYNKHVVIITISKLSYFHIVDNDYETNN